MLVVVGNQPVLDKKKASDSHPVAHIVLHTAACNVAASAVAVVAFAAGAAVVFSSCNPVNIVCGSSLNWVSAFPAGHQVVAAAVAQMAVDTGESYYFADMVGEDVEDGWLDWDHIDSAQEGKHNPFAADPEVQQWQLLWLLLLL